MSIRTARLMLPALLAALAACAAPARPDPQIPPAAAGTEVPRLALHNALKDAFARGGAPAALTAGIEAASGPPHSRYLEPGFVDDHDADGGRADGSVEGLEQALWAAMILSGLPAAACGPEHAFVEQDAARFAAGWGLSAAGQFDAGAPLRRRFDEMNALRAAMPALRCGAPRMVFAERTGPGTIAWVMAHEAGDALVVFNTADRPVLLERLELGLANRNLVPAFALRGPAPAGLLTWRDGVVRSMVLPPREGLVFRLEPDSVRDEPSRFDYVPTIDAPAPIQSGAHVEVTGQALPGADLLVVLDGDLQSAVPARAGPAERRGDGRFSARVPIGHLVDPAVTHRIVVWDSAQGGLDGGRGAASSPATFQVRPVWLAAAAAGDSAGDDTGPAGRYIYPSDPTYGPRTMDLRAVRAFTSGGALRLEIETAAISRVWAPRNGFDHVSFTVFIELPGLPGGVRHMPLQSTTLPDGMVWHRRLRVHGWSNAMFASAGAGPAAEGERTGPPALVTVHADARMVRLLIPAAALGNPTSLSGARIVVATWDYNGGYRRLTAAGGAWAMGGRTAPDDPLVMDMSPVLTLRPRPTE